MGKKLERKGRLANVQIDSIQHIYGNAIRRNKNNLEQMKKHVWAIYFHMLSTDINRCIISAQKSAPTDKHRQKTSATHTNTKAVRMKQS